MDRETLDAPFDLFLDFAKEVERVLHLSVTAIRGMEGSSRLFEVLNEGKLDEPEKKEVADWFREMERLAAAEIQKEFPLLVSHSIVAIWSAFESTVPEFAANWLAYRPAAYNLPDLRRIRLPVTAFNELEPNELREATIDELTRQLSSNLKPGIGRFEALLAAIGLGGAVDDKLRKTIFEMSNVRNLIVHRFARVDRQFKERCPWINAPLGERLQIGLSDYNRYQSALFEYAALILERTRQHGSELNEPPDSGLIGRDG